MNARIKELAEQAGYTKDMFGIGHWDMPEFKKFAELILADIDKLIDVAYISYPIEQAVVCLDIDFLIKQHFYGLQNEN